MTTFLYVVPQFSQKQRQHSGLKITAGQRTISGLIGELTVISSSFLRLQVFRNITFTYLHDSNVVHSDTAVSGFIF